LLFRSHVYRTKPNLNALVSDPLVRAELRRAWYESNPGAPEVRYDASGSIKREQGGWIVRRKQTGRLSVLRVPAGGRDVLRTILGTRPTDDAAQEVVGWFHTHPNTLNEGYSSEPGFGDIRFTHAEAKAPGIVETHDGPRPFRIHNGSLRIH